MDKGTTNVFTIFLAGLSCFLSLMIAYFAFMGMGSSEQPLQPLSICLISNDGTGHTCCLSAESLDFYHILHVLIQNQGGGVQRPNATQHWKADPSFYVYLTLFSLLGQIRYLSHI